MYVKCENEQMEYLIKKDKLLGEIIKKLGPIRRKKDTDLFSSVVHHIVGQQISTKAQETIWNRLNEKLVNINEKTLVSISKEELQSVGLTFRKVEYIQDFANKVLTKEFDVQKVACLDDEELTKELVKLKGIGVWTAEMIMIFCLDRLNILSYDDLAIRRGLRMLYHHRSIDKKKFDKYKRRYSPYATLAGLYLWEIAGGKIEGMKDYAPKSKRRS